ncbi:MAG: ATP-binding cassette domain-containing protein [Oscillospiraceae bacterium]|jgi:ABC-type nitrate/sulfonate/bicarbonate transport system ATPase subunit|nr:ATP-binding cassette domain-containing protein [Oscillospiraceae bacterium]
MIAFIGVSKRFGEKIVLDNFNWTLPRGARVCIGGSSGAGKTTLLRLLARLDRPDAGAIEGLPASASYQFQENRLLPWYTARRNLRLVTDEPDEWLDRVGLRGEGGSYPGELSGGMRRRLSLARALASPAPLLLLDEPFMELDSDSKTRVMDAVRGQSGAMDREWIILVTHNQLDADALGFEYQTPLTRRAESGL